MFTLRSLCSFAVSLAFSTLVSAGGEPTLEQRLAQLSDALEAARLDGRVPGMSIAIVLDDEIVWARGFGLAEVASGRPADENTIYAIGSTTKAFTATLVGMLVDEGKASWDDPVTRYLPHFDLAVRSDDENAECTLRDLLSHRHGFARMSILWNGGRTSREEVLRTAAGAEPWDDFRAGFHYCNVTYLAAGEAAGVAADSTWDELMVERIFDPLGMTASTLSVSEARKDARLALGYVWDEVDEQFETKRMVHLDNIGPAGSVNSNVLDMAQWLRLQLGRGQVDGERLISDRALRETWTSQIEIDDGVGYGLGWMLREHAGRRVVEHGGNIDGFSAQVGLMPDENLGYVLLMNRDVAPLQQTSLALVFDALLEEWPDDGNLASAGEIDLQDYVGTYVANFAKFRDEEFEVRANEERLVLDIPSQQAFELERPDAEGKWGFVLTDQIRVSFQRDREGAIAGLTVHQGGFDFDVPRKGVEPELETAAEGLDKFVGTYVRAEGGKRVKLFIERGRLTMEDGGNWLAFHAPDAEGHASLRARADHGATFAIDAEGGVESFIYHGNAGDKLFTRLADAPDGELPTLAEILALRKTDERMAMQAAGGTEIRGKVWVAQAGVHGSVKIYTQGSDRFASHLDFGRFGRIDTVANGDAAWSYDSMRGFQTLEGNALTQARLAHPGAVEGDWSDYFDSIEVVRDDVLDDRPVHVVRLQRGDLPSRTYWVDAEHGDVLRVKHVMLERTVRIPVTVTYADFEEVDGLRWPLRATVENPASGRTVMTFERPERGLELGDEVFTLTEPEAGEDADD